MQLRLWAIEVKLDVHSELACLLSDTGDELNSWVFELDCLTGMAWCGHRLVETFEDQNTGATIQCDYQALPCLYRNHQALPCYTVLGNLLTHVDFAVMCMLCHDNTCNGGNLAGIVWSDLLKSSSSKAVWLVKTVEPRKFLNDMISLTVKVTSKPRVMPVAWFCVGSVWLVHQNRCLLPHRVFLLVWSHSLYLCIAGYQQYGYFLTCYLQLGQSRLISKIFIASTLAWSENWRLFPPCVQE